ncbi:MAG: DUF2635 domain-containing protein [Betaproteobacteria bacterium]|nr:DUF2635 domain-containing protein [Betaproteobacteria bacterium]
MYVKPAPGLRIVDPILRDFLPEEGRPVTPSGYWRRMLRDGDVILVPEPTVQSAEHESKPVARKRDAE